MASDPLFPTPPRRSSVWQRSVPTSAHRRFDFVLGGLLAVMVAGWSVGIVEAAEQGTSPTEGLTASPLGGGASPETAYLLDALVERFTGVESLRGRSGALRVVVPEPGTPLRVPEVPSRVELELVEPPREEGEPPPGPGTPPAEATGPGLWALSLRSGRVTRTVPGLRVLTQLPTSAKEDGRIGEYLVGDWPFERTEAREGYETPRGVVEVTPENRDLPVSEHFTLGDFLTKGQEDVWPKYVVLSTRLLDKLELTLQELEEMGHPVEDVGIISGFRTPHYNAGGGNTSGRGDLSRHMYGDAMDFYVDNDGDGCMDDLDGDGDRGIAEARIIADAAERVSEEHPDLEGGIGTYSPTGAHCGFVHIDTRGWSARW